MKNKLTARVIEVAQTFYKMDGNRDQICDYLSIHHSTLRSHLDTLFDYFCVHSSVALMKALIESGKIPLEREGQA